MVGRDELGHRGWFCAQQADRFLRTGPAGQFVNFRALDELLGELADCQAIGTYQAIADDLRSRGEQITTDAGPGCHTAEVYGELAAEFDRRGQHVDHARRAGWPVTGDAADGDPSPVAVRLADIAGHLARFGLGEPWSVEVHTERLRGEAVTVQLLPYVLSDQVAELAAWADTLDGPALTVWRVATGEDVHLRLTGRLPGGSSARVYAGTDYTPDLIGPLAPGDTRMVPLALLDALVDAEAGER